MSRPVPISIALPVYNGANYLREALDSIQAQTFTDFEIVVSDNASTDETMDICYEYARRWSGHELLRAKLTGRRSHKSPPLPYLTTATVRKCAWLGSGCFPSSFLHFDIFLWMQLLIDWDYM